jgi:hypothetical protein
LATGRASSPKNGDNASELLTLASGHGPYSNVYGLGVEQVLDFQVVTPNGDILNANPKQNQDLFWALRGGGASTFGIVTKVSYKAYPAPNVTFLALYMTPKDNSTAAQDAWYDAMAYYLAIHPNMTDFGLSGYPSLMKDSYSGMLMAPGKSEKEVLDFWAPFGKKLEAYGIVHEPNIITNDEFVSMTDLGASIGNSGPAEPSGLLFSMSSRLFSRTILKESNVPDLSKMLKVILSDPGSYLLPYPNIPGVTHQNRAWDFGLNPAWKTSSLHMISIWHLEVGDDVGKIGGFKTKRGIANPLDKVREMEQKMTKTYIPAMDRLSQNSGAYINEVNFSFR